MLRSFWRRLLSGSARTTRPARASRLQPLMRLEERAVPTVALGISANGKDATITLNNAADVATVQLIGMDLTVPGAKDINDLSKDLTSVKADKLENLTITGTAGTVNLEGSFSVKGTLTISGGVTAFDLKANQAFDKGISIDIKGAYNVDNKLDVSGGNVVLLSSGLLTISDNVTVSGNVGLDGAGGISQTAGIIDAAKVAARSTGGAVTLDKANTVGTFAATTTAQNVSFTSASTLTIGSVATFDGFPATSGIDTSGGSVTITTDKITVSNIIKAGAGVITFAPRTVSQVDFAGPDSGTALGLDVTDIANLSTTGGVRVNAGSGKINLAGSVSLSAKIEFDAGAGGVSGTGILTTDNLLVITTGAVDLSKAHSLKNVAISAGGKVTVNTTKALNVGTVTVVGSFSGIKSGGNDVTLAGTDLIAVSDALDAGAGTVRIAATNAVTQTAAGLITAAKLGVTSSASGITLDQANVVDTFIGAPVAGSAIKFRSTKDLAINTVGNDGTLFTDPLTVKTSGGNATLVGKSLDLKVAVTAGAGTVRLGATGGNIVQTGVVTANTLGANATGSVTLSGSNVVDKVAAGAGAAQTIDVKSTKAVDITSVTSDGAFVATTGIKTTGGSATLQSAGAVSVSSAVDVGAGKIGFEISGDLTQTATVTAGTLAVKTGGAITLDLANSVDNVALATSAAKNISFRSTVDLKVASQAAFGLFTGATGVSSTGGTIGINDAGKTLTISQSINSGGKNITLSAKAFDVTATVDAGVGCVFILPGAGNNITLGDGGDLTDAELGKITAAILQVGDFTNADITVVGKATLGASVPTLDLRAGGDVKTTAGADLSVTNLALQTNTAGKVIDFTLGKSNATTLAIDAADAASYTDANGLSIGSVTVCDGTETGAKTAAGSLAVTATGKVTVDQAVNGKASVTLTTTGANALDVKASVSSGGKIALTAGSALTLAADVATATSNVTVSGGTLVDQTGGKITASTLELLGSGTAKLVSTTNNVGTLAANFSGDLTYVDTDGVAFGTAGGTSNVTATGKNVRIESGGKITGGAGTHVTSAGLALVASTGIGSLSTSIDNLEAKSTTGDITIVNGGTLTIGGVAGDLSGVAADGGNVSLTASTGTLKVTTEGITSKNETKLLADALDITQGVVAECVTIRQVTAANTVKVGGADAAGVLGVTDAELNKLTTTKGVRIGRTDGGDLSVTSAIAVTGPLELISGGKITNGGVGTITVSKLAVDAGGIVSLTGANAVITIAGKSGGDFTFHTSTVITVGSVTVCDDTFNGIDASGKQIVLSGADPTFDQAVLGDCVIITPATAGNTLDIGTQITNASLNKITAKLLQIGDGTTGAITLSAAVSVSAAKLPSIHIVTDKTVTALGGSIGVKTLAVTAANSGAATTAVNLSGDNAVTSLAIDGVGAIVFTNKANTPLTIETVPTCMATLTDINAHGAAVTLTADEMTVTAQIKAGTSAVILAPRSASTGVVLGANPATAGTLELDDAELNQITAGLLQVGTSSTGAVNVSGAIDLTNGQVSAAIGRLDLRSSGNVTQSAAITVDKLGVSSGGAVTLNSLNDVGTIAGTSKDNFAFTAKVITVGSVVVADTTRNGIVSTNDGNIILTSDTMDVTNVLDAGTGCVILQERTAGTVVTLGAETAGLKLTDAELNQVTASILRIGSGGAGAITFAGDINLKSGQVSGKSVGTLELQSAQSVSGPGAVVVGKLGIVAGTGVSLVASGNDVDTLGIDAEDNVSYLDANALTLGSVMLCLLGTLNGIDTTNDVVTVQADDLTISQPVLGDNVIIRTTTTGKAIDLGVDLTDAELDFVTAKILQIGDGTAGAITVSSAISLANAKVPTLHLWSAAGVSEKVNGTLSVTNLGVTAGGAVALANDNSIGTVAVTTTGTVDVTQKANTSITVGTVTVIAGPIDGIVSGGKNIHIVADEMNFTQQVNAGTANVILAPRSASTGVVLGANPATAGTLELDDAELNQITAGLLQVGTSSTGAVNVSGAIDLTNGQVSAAIGRLDLRSSGNVTQSAAITVDKLGVSSGGAVTLNSLNDVGTIAGTSKDNFAFTAKVITVGSVVVADTTRNGIVSTNDGNIILTSDTMDVTNVLDAGTGCVILQERTAGTVVTLGAETAGLKLTDAELNQVTASILRIGSGGAGAITFAGDINLKSGQVSGKSVGTLELQSAQSVSGPGAVVVGKLGIVAGTGVSLVASGNDVDTLGIDAEDNVSYLDANALTLGSVMLCLLGTLNGIDTTNDVVTVQADDLTISQPVLGDNVIIRTTTTGKAIDLGVDLTDAELDFVTAKILQIGDGTAGAITVSSAISLANAKVPTLHLWSAAGVSEKVNGTLSVTNLGVTAGGAVALANDNSIGTVAVTTTGTVDVTQKANTSITVGTVTVIAGPIDGIVSGGKNIHIVADEMNFTQQVNAATACVMLDPRTDATAIVLGDNPGSAGTLELSDAELDFVAAGILQAGRSTSGAVTVAGPVDLTNGQKSGSAVDTLDIRSSGDISGNAVITAKSLALAAGGNVNLTAANLVGTLAGIAGTDFKYTNGQALLVDSVTVCDGVRTGITATNGLVDLNNSDSINLKTNVSAKSTVSFNTTAGGVGQFSGSLTAPDGVRLLGAGTFYLDQPGNSFPLFASNNAGLTVARTKGGLTIGKVAGTDGITMTAGDLFLRTGDGFTFDGQVTSINLGAGAGEVRTGFNDDGSGAATSYPLIVRAVDSGGNNKLVASPVNGFAIFAGTNSNVLAVEPSTTTPIFVRGGLPTPTQVNLDVNKGPIIPGDELATPVIKGVRVSLQNLNAAEGNGVFTFTDPNNGAVELRRPILFESIENIRGLTIQAAAVQTGPNQYQIVANGSLNGQPITGGFTGTLPPAAPFLAAPQFTNPFGPYRAPTISIGDVDGNNFPDVIVANGSAAPPLVTVIRGERIFNSKFPPNSVLGANDILAQFYAYTPTFQGGVYVAAGDITGDGQAEIVTGPGAGGGPDVRVFGFSKNQPMNSNINQLTGFYAYEPTFLGGVRVAVGDVNGDDKLDIVTAPGAGRATTVKVINGHTLNQAGANAPMSSFEAYAGSQNGVFIDVGRYTLDGAKQPDKYGDILTGAGFGGGAHVKVINGEVLSKTGVAQTAIEFFNDGPGSGAADPTLALTCGVGSVGYGQADTDGLLDIYVGSGLNRRTRVRVYLNGQNTADSSGGKLKDYLNLQNTVPGPYDTRLDGANVAVSAGNV
ncbi:MAG: hypothetical protein K1X57_06185 [Gemmataceae bacterium]|nr:hypothetical protein [Gemmataceae bacterium]